MRIYALLPYFIFGISVHSMDEATPGKRDRLIPKQENTRLNPDISLYSFVIQCKDPIFLGAFVGTHTKVTGEANINAIIDFTSMPADEKKECFYSGLPPEIHSTILGWTCAYGLPWKVKKLLQLNADPNLAVIVINKNKDLIAMSPLAIALLRDKPMAEMVKYLVKFRAFLSAQDPLEAKEMYQEYLQSNLEQRAKEIRKARKIEGKTRTQEKCSIM